MDEEVEGGTYLENLHVLRLDHQTLLELHPLVRLVHPQPRLPSSSLNARTEWTITISQPLSRTKHPISRRLTIGLANDRLGLG
jgi:hypothetical protein